MVFDYSLLFPDYGWVPVIIDAKNIDPNQYKTVEQHQSHAFPEHTFNLYMDADKKPVVATLVQ